jgi:transposase-like protein
MKSTPEVICSAMQIYFSGVSLRKTAESLILRGVRVSHVSVYSWISKYISLMEKYVEQIKPNVSEKWRTDELYLKMKGDKKWLFAVMDDETRFWIAQQVGNHKGVSDIRPMMKEAKRITEKEPKVIISDAAHNFGVAIAEELPNSKHIGEIRLEGKVHNNKQERLNGELRDREKVMRSLKKKDTPILKGMQIFHNYVRPHMALQGKTPAEKAGIEVKGLNKWMTLIQNATSESRKPKNDFEGI